MILALETTSDLCSIAVRDLQGTLVEREFRHRMHLSERLIRDVEEVLADAETNLEEIDALAVGIGPGSFTGVRLGVTTVKTWADLLEKQVVGVSSLEAIAAEHSREDQSIVVPIVRARPGSVYAGFYSNNAPGSVKQVTMEELVSRLKASRARCYIVGYGLPNIEEELRRRCAGDGMSAQITFGAATFPRASTVASIAERHIAEGRTDDALALTPLYVSAPPIDPTVEKRIKRAI